MREETFTFLQDILLEVMDIFPSQFIHIGGDEVLSIPSRSWPDALRKDRCLELFCPWIVHILKQIR